MKKLYTFFLTCTLIYNACSQTKYSKDIEEQIRLVENSLSGRIKFEGTMGDNILSQMAFYNVKGMSVAVVKDYKIIWAKGYGWADEAAKIPVTENTLFQVASVSKSVNSMGVLKLVQDKKLELNNDINDYLLSWKFPYDSVSRGQKITTLNLLTHTGGINNGAAMYIKDDTIPTAIQVLNGTRGSRFIWGETPSAHSIMEPNKKSYYSNLGVAMTQIMISDITKKTYEEYMTQAVFNPLGMTNSCYNEKSLKSRKIATGYDSDGREIKGKHVIIPSQSAGGLWTTATDLAKFICELQLAYEGRSAKVLNQETVKRMMTPYVDSLTGAGVFFRRREKDAPRYFGHSGSLHGFKSEYSGSLEGGNGVVVLINSAGNADRIISEVINSVAAVYKWKGFYKPLIKAKPVTVPDELLAKCEGVYCFEDKFAVITKKADGGHYWSDGIDSKMHFSNEKEFFNIEFLSTKELVLDASGNVTSIKRFFNGKELTPAIKIMNADTLNRPAYQLSNIGWHLLENKKFAQSLNFFTRSARLNPKDLMNFCNIAHCYLFLNEYDKAIKLYKENIDKKINERYTFKEAVIEDFSVFKNKGFDTKLMDKVFSELKIEVPERYK